MILLRDLGQLKLVTDFEIAIMGKLSGYGNSSELVIDALEIEYK